jgi:hypothetical protein
MGVRFRISEVSLYALRDQWGEGRTMLGPISNPPGSDVGSGVNPRVAAPFRKALDEDGRGWLDRERGRDGEGQRKRGTENEREGERQRVRE